MNLPVLAADVSSIGLDTVIPAGAVLVVGGGLLAWARSQTTTENEVKTLRVDLNAANKAIEDLEKDAKTDRENSERERKAEREAYQKRIDDLVHRISQIEGREGRVDERMQAMQSGLQDVKKGQDQMLGMISELLSLERSSARRRRDDKDAA